MPGHNLRLIVRENNLQGGTISQCRERPRARHALSHFSQTTSHYICSYIQLRLHLLLCLHPTTSYSAHRPLKPLATTSTQIKSLASHYVDFCTSDSHYSWLHLTRSIFIRPFSLHPGHLFDIGVIVSMVQYGAAVASEVWQWLKAGLSQRWQVSKRPLGGRDNPIPTVLMRILMMVKVI